MHAGRLGNGQTDWEGERSKGNSGGKDGENPVSEETNVPCTSSKGKALLKNFIFIAKGSACSK